MKKNQHILFVHIPKTAGTSFRISAEEYYAEDEVFYDYSIQARETSKLIVEKIYKYQDFYGFYNTVLNKLDKSFLSGHFHSNKYASLYDTLNIVSFVRNPVEQVLSHFNHHKSRNGYDENFKTFIKDKRFCNIQSKALGDKPIGMYGFLGITEAYDSSIFLFNRLYNVELKTKHINKKSNHTLALEDININLLKLIERLNARDIRFYKAVKAQFEVRKALEAKGLVFTHGFIQKCTSHEIMGIAFQKDNEEAIAIDIYLGKQYLETVYARKLRVGQRNISRKGYIGFDYVYNGENKNNQKFLAFNSVTGQEIMH
ncbi:hypothetical protein MNB_SV-13-469 [hydrothermal vent metagenome]|uniref:Sulfotransferase family protein n=1 Tax=hydrothermal vent metagenome TaxID=652676 RepID=A0A1W1CZF1_9ZZZZ